MTRPTKLLGAALMLLAGVGVALAQGAGGGGPPAGPGGGGGGGRRGGGGGGGGGRGNGGGGGRGVVTITGQDVGIAATQLTAKTPYALPYITEARKEITALPSPPLVPKNASDLKTIQDRVEAVQKFSMPATVGIIMPDWQGSGVIVSKDGYVLTAGHVSGPAGVDVTIVMSNGTLVRAISLGANNIIDSGMIKIVTPGDYPFVSMKAKDSTPLIAGQWVVAMGHPGGYRQGRPPVVRLGRVLTVKNGNSAYVTTDCPLINGDSGGPLFDLDGQLIGINSRIGAETTKNLHVPIDTFEDTWPRLAHAEVWGPSILAGTGRSTTDSAPSPRLGVKVDDNATGGLVVLQVQAGTPAESVGFNVDDIITKLDGQAILNREQWDRLMMKHKPGDKVTVDISRNGRPQQISVTLAASVGN